MPSLLIVDDDQFSRTLLKDILAPLGCEVAEAHNGLEAVKQAQARRWDLILLDLFMPVKSGIEALMEIRKGDPEAKVLVISSLSSEVLLDQALTAGARGFILKPFHPLEITRAVKRELSVE